MRIYIATIHTPLENASFEVQANGLWQATVKVWDMIEGSARSTLGINLDEINCVELREELD